MIVVATTAGGMIVGSFLGWGIALTTSTMDDLEGFVYKTLGGALVGTLVGSYLGTKI